MFTRFSDEGMTLNINARTLPLKKKKKKRRRRSFFSVPVKNELGGERGVRGWMEGGKGERGREVFSYGRRKSVHDAPCRDLEIRGVRVIMIEARTKCKENGGLSFSWCDYCCCCF